MKKILILSSILFLFFSFFSIAQSTDSVQGQEESQGQTVQSEDSSTDVTADALSEFDDENAESIADTDGEDFEDDEEDSKYQLKNRMYKNHRIFELGMNIDFGVSNNFTGISEVLKKDLVLDVVEMVDTLPEEGADIRLNLLNDYYSNLYLKNGTHIGTKIGVETYGFANISKDLFDYLAKGFSAGKTLKVDGDIDADAFLYAGAQYGMDLFGFHGEVGASIVRPLLHVEADSMRASFRNAKDGSVKVDALTVLEMYSYTDLEPIIEDNDFGGLADDLGTGWGFDLDLQVEHPIFDTLQGAAYVHLPIVPGHLGYYAEKEVSMTYEVSGIEKMINGDTGESDTDNKDIVYGTTSYYLHRPFRTGAQIAWRPFGSWWTSNALLGFGVAKPFSDDAKGYVEYSLGTDVRVLEILGINLSTSYLKQVFIHQAGLMFNFRVFEMDLGISSQSSSFLTSFKGGGVGGFINFAVGF